MRFLLISVFIILGYAQNMQILSKTFEYNQTNNVSKFSGDVNATKGLDNILSKILFVYTNKDKKLKKLVAIGDVRFVVHDKNATYKGTSEKLTYIKAKDLFIFEKKVHITKIEDNQQLFGDKVVINQKTGSANVVGAKNKPLKFIIKVND